MPILEFKAGYVIKGAGCITFSDPYEKNQIDGKSAENDC